MLAAEQTDRMLGGKTAAVEAMRRLWMFTAKSRWMEEEGEETDGVRGQTRQEQSLKARPGI